MTRSLIPPVNEMPHVVSGTKKALREFRASNVYGLPVLALMPFSTDAE